MVKCSHFWLQLYVKTHVLLHLKSIKLLSLRALNSSVMKGQRSFDSVPHLTFKRLLSLMQVDQQNDLSTCEVSNDHFIDADFCFHLVCLELMQSTHGNVFYIYQPNVCLFHLFKWIYLTLLFQCLGCMKITLFWKCSKLNRNVFVCFTMGPD